MKKVLLIDDEAAGRQLLREYLAEYPDFVILDEANNGVDAVRLCNTYHPDLVFLDVKMPGLTGFEVLTHLAELPRVIFSTAYDQYAMEAFEVHAVDYLLKPYTRERFSRAMRKLNFERDENTAAPLAESLLAGSGTYPERILVSKGRKLVPLTTACIIWIAADGDYCRLHTADDVYHSSYGISSIEEKLDPATFLRVHRSSIVNISKIREAHRYGKSYDLVMLNGQTVRVSRGYMDRLRDLTF
ncbi:Sensory transduction protein LytR [Neolewinella maritima]|uniref:Sensory transduction protein LytR n=1 Tax=Neolewinella maritima TaxID=1383882 RepID=A0ABM9B0Q1_9BACT|nr:LytTR family DNA-binding domain-containing protein [Neolewinella maritima]CAH1000683.1 Sensory transduction protein LytR [Neolewinella maritima]